MARVEADIDDIDRRIVDLLCENARRTFGDIGERVGLSAPAVKRRVSRLEELGVIQGYTARLDHARLGEPLEAFAELRFTGRARVDDIEGIAASVPEVHAVFTIAGDPDALAWIRVRDVDHLKTVIDRLRHTGTVTGTKTLIVLGSSIRPDRPPPDKSPARARPPVAQAPAGRQPRTPLASVSPPPPGVAGRA